jgi:hypothetical protein
MNHKGIVESFYKQLLTVESGITGVKPAEDKWSLKEIVGHLIDSASNNHQRFVRLQISDLLDFPPYQTEVWVGIQKNNNMNWDTLISLWYNYNLLLLNIIDGMDENKLQNVWIKDETAIPLNELVIDYFSHLELHIEHFNSRLSELKNSNN